MIFGSESMAARVGWGTLTEKLKYYNFWLETLTRSPNMKLDCAILHNQEALTYVYKMNDILHMEETHESNGLYTVRTPGSSAPD